VILLDYFLLLTGTISCDSPTFKISIKEYEDMQLKVGDKVTIQVKKSREYWSLITHRLTLR
jgi:hypothetical protein